MIFLFFFLVAAEDASSAAQALAAVPGVSKVISASGAQFKGGVAENMAPLLKAAQVATGATHVIGPATPYGKNILPRLAAMLDVNNINDVTLIKSEDTFERPIYAGNAIATVQSLDAIKVGTIFLISKSVILIKILGHLSSRYCFCSS